MTAEAILPASILQPPALELNLLEAVPARFAYKIINKRVYTLKDKQLNKVKITCIKSKTIKTLHACCHLPNVLLGH